MRQSLVVAALLLSHLRVTLGEVPSVSSLFPAGAQRGETTTVKLNGKPGTQPLSVWTESSELSDFKFDEKGNNLTFTVGENARPGRHWIRVYNAEGGSDPLPIQVGMLPSILETEPNNSASQAQRIDSLPVTVDGTLHKSGEVDTFAVSLKKGQTLTASVDAHAEFASPMDSVLQILDERGFVITQNDDDHGFDPMLQLPISVDGTYLVRIFCFPATPNSTINFAGGTDYVYRLNLTTDEFQSSPQTDKSEAQPGLHSYLNRYEQHRAIDSDDSHAGSQFPIVQTFQITDSESVFRLPVTFKKSESIRVQVHARSIGSHLDPVLTIRKPDGSVHKESDDASREDQDIDYVWTPSAEKEYSLEFRDRFGHSGPRYHGLVVITQNNPRYELTIASNKFQLDRKKPLEIPVTVNRISNYKETIHIDLEGAPAGLKFETVESKGEGDTAKKVTLTLEAGEAEAFSGPITIIGTKSDSDQQVLATTDLKVTGETTSSIWLTIPQKEETE